MTYSSSPYPAKRRPIISASALKTWNAGMKDKAILPEVEIQPDAWEKFERAVDNVVKGGPQHKTGKSKGEMKVGDDAHDKRDRGNRRGDDRGS
jgi:hypothetical protein